VDGDCVSPELYSNSEGCSPIAFNAKATGLEFRVDTSELFEGIRARLSRYKMYRTKNPLSRIDSHRRTQLQSA
jgi:hypothetical protein